MTRQLIGQPDAPVLAPADQKLSVAEAVHANTMGAAYQVRLDGLVGSVEVGKRADLIVLDSNIFRGRPTRHPPHAGDDDDDERTSPPPALAQAAITRNSSPLRYNSAVLLGIFGVPGIGGAAE